MWAQIANGCDLLALLTMVGALVQVGWLFPAPASPALEAAGAQMSRRADRYLAGALAWLTLTTAAALFARSADISGLSLKALGPVVPQVLQRTHFGHVWLLRTTVVMGLWLGWWLLRARKPHRVFALFALACVLIEAWGWSVTAHPGDDGNFALAVWAAVLHILAAGLWGGTVLAVAVVAAPAGRLVTTLEAGQVLLFVRRLSAVSAVGLILVVASGVYNAWRQLAHFTDFWTSTYGQVLDVKLALVLLLAALGAGNRYSRVPRLLRTYRMTPRSVSADGTKAQQHQAVRLLLRAIVWEAIVLLAIVAVVSVLVHTMPPADAQVMLHP